MTIHQSIPHLPGKRGFVSNAYQFLNPINDENIQHDSVRKALFQAAKDAGRALSLSANETTLLRYLVSCYGNQKSIEGMMVFPSNQTIIDNLGLKLRVLQRNIKSLRIRGLIIANDSPNGKRYPLKDRNGNIVAIYGFDLTPLYQQAKEFREIVDTIDHERKTCKNLRTEISAQRQHIISILMLLSPYQDNANVNMIRQIFADLELLAKTSVELHEQLASHYDLYKTAKTVHDNLLIIVKKTGCECQSDTHIETNKKNHSERCNKSRGANAPQLKSNSSAKKGGKGAFSEESVCDVRYTEQKKISSSNISNDPDLWIKACPIIRENLGQGYFSIEHISALGSVLSVNVQASSHAHEEIKNSIGALNHGLLIIYINQIIEDDQKKPQPSVVNPGGFLRSLARNIHNGKIDFAKDLMNMWKKRLS